MGSRAGGLRGVGSDSASPADVASPSDSCQPRGLDDFPVGAVFVATDRLRMRLAESLESDKVGEVQEGSLCRILAHGCGATKRRVMIESDAGAGWVSYCTADGEVLLNQ